MPQDFTVTAAYNKGGYQVVPKDDLKECMKHQYTVELLFHFNCGTCKNWWSYATTPSCLSGSIEYNSLPENIDYYCPHCGAAEKVEIKGGFAGK